MTMTVTRLRDLGQQILDAINQPVQERLQQITKQQDELYSRIKLADKARDDGLLQFANGKVENDVIRRDKTRAVDLREQQRDLHDARLLLEQKIIISPPQLRIDMVAVALRNCIAHAAKTQADGKPLHPDEGRTFRANLGKLKADLATYRGELANLGATDEQVAGVADAGEALIDGILAHSEYDPTEHLTNEVAA